jgi:hypothetical protein
MDLLRKILPEVTMPGSEVVLLGFALNIVQYILFWAVLVRFSG